MALASKLAVNKKVVFVLFLFSLLFPYVLPVQLGKADPQEIFIPGDYPPQ